MSLTSKWYGFGADADYDEATQCVERGQLAEAAVLFAKVSDRNHDRSLRQMARLHLGDVFGRLLRDALARRDAEDAVSWGEQAVALNPNFPDLRLQFARALILAERFEEAFSEAEKATELNERYAEAYVLQAGVRALLNQDWQARAERAFGLSPNLREPAESLLQKTSQGDAHAWTVLQTLSSAHSRDANVIAAEADDLAKQRLFPAAALRYQKALEMAPRYADIQCRYGQTLLEMDRLPAAIDAFEKALEINPRYAEAWAQLGIAYKRERRDDDARRAFEKAVEADPHHIIASQELRRHSAR